MDISSCDRPEKKQSKDKMRKGKALPLCFLLIQWPHFNANSMIQHRHCCHKKANQHLHLRQLKITSLTNSLCTAYLFSAINSAKFGYFQCTAFVEKYNQQKHIPSYKFG